MSNRPRPFLCFAFWWMIATMLHAQDGSVRAVRVHASTQANPPQITLHWEPSPYSVETFNVFRRPPGTSTWTYLGNNPAPTATSFVDATVQSGVRYEYKVYRQYVFAEFSNHARGYTIAGNAAPLLDQRGKVILLVDSTKQSALAPEIETFTNDLIGDGWTVLIQSAAPSDSPVSVRETLRSLYNTDPANVKAAILLGRIPVPYSGNISPDGHTPDHRGAWPADTYYADLDGVWTDTAVDNATAASVRNHNVPGDGKMDQSNLPSDADIAIGRIDMANLNGFSAGVNETELLRNYLRKNHEFRHRLGAYSDIPARGLIRDGLNYLGGEAPASAAWRGFSAMFGPGQVVVTANWFPTLELNKYLWAYGSGSGSYTSAAGIGSSSDFKTKTSLAVFNLLFGSYFGDWDSPNDNFLRVPLADATGSLGLVSIWANRPDWNIHGMALGETIGDAYLRTVNNPGDISSNWNVGYFNPHTNTPRMVHIALMGDPTLRLHPVAPPMIAAAPTRMQGTSTDTIHLTWHAPAEANIVGYHIYRSDSALGPFTRLTNSPVAATSYTDVSAPKATIHYHVRTVVLTGSASGTYYNAGQALGFMVPVSAPASVSAVTATAISDTEVSIKWGHSGMDTDAYRVERRAVSGGTWNLVSILDHSARTFSDAGLVANVSYEYRVAATNIMGTSFFANSSAVTTLALVTLVHDSYTDGDVTNGIDALDVAWSRTCNTFHIVTDGLLDSGTPGYVAGLSMSTANKDEYISFALPSPVSLEVSQGLRVQFKLRHTDAPRADALTTGVSIAHTPNARAEPWNNVSNREYFFLSSYGNSTPLGSIRKTGSGGAQLLNTGTQTLASNLASIDAGTHATTVMLEVFRSGTDTMRVRFRLGNGPVQEVSDSAGIVTAFNRVYLRFRTRSDSAVPRFRIDDVFVHKLAASSIPPTSPIQTWREEHFTSAQLANAELEFTLWGNLADPDADGLNNLCEYALGTHPLASESASPLQLQLSNSRLQIKFFRARDDVVYEVQASSTLQPESWTVIDTNPGRVGEVVTVDDTVTITGHARRFFRLHLSR